MKSDDLIFELLLLRLFIRSKDSSHITILKNSRFTDTVIKLNGYHYVEFQQKKKQTKTCDKRTYTSQEKWVEESAYDLYSHAYYTYMNTYCKLCEKWDTFCER